MSGKKRKSSTLLLLTRFKKIAVSRQQIIQLMAVVYHPIAAPKLYACVQELGIKKSNNDKFTHKALLETLASLKTSGFLKCTGNQFFIVEAIAEQLCRQLLASGQFKNFSDAVDRLIPVGKSWDRNYLASAKQGYRLIRSAIYTHQAEQLNNWANIYYKLFYKEYKACNPVLNICLEPFDSDLLNRLSGDVLSMLIHEAMTDSSQLFTNISRLMNWLLDAFDNGHLQQAEQLAFMCAGHFIFNGELDKARRLLPCTNDYYHLLINAWLQFLQGENEQAIANFEQAIVLAKKMSGKRKLFINNIGGVFFILALIKSDDAVRLQQAIDYSTFHLKQKQCANTYSHQKLAALLGFIKTGYVSDYNTNIRHNNWQDYHSTLAFILHCYYLYWSDKDLAVKQVAELKRYIKAAEKGDNQWLAAEAYQLLSVLDKKGEAFTKKADDFFQQRQIQSLMSVVRYKEKWEHTLDALSLLEQPGTPVNNNGETRLVWFISGLDKGNIDVQPKLQKRTVKGGWTKGRNVSLQRLKLNQEEYDNLCVQDNLVRSCIVEDYYSYYSHDAYELDILPALKALTGHPYLFDADHDARHIELIASEPEIRIQKKQQQLFISMYPVLKEDENTLLQKETETRWKVISFNSQHQRLSALLDDGLTVPLSEKERVLAAMSSIAPLVNIHSDIGGNTGNLKTVAADSGLHILLAPADGGFSVEAKIRVFGEQGPYYSPGTGSETIITEIAGERLQTQRHLQDELQQFTQMLDACPALQLEPHDDFRWYLDDPEDCLEILSELQAIKDQVTIAWPKGEKLAIKQQLSLSQFRLNIDGENDWFSVSGELPLDNGEVLNMKRLLELSQSAKGRFIKLADGQFMALSKTFQQRLKALHKFGEIKGNAVQLHPLAALTLDDMTDEVGQFKAGKNWQQFSQHFEQAMALQPDVPSTLQAELRDYQQLGFQWLARLAHWGAGACLADDMGLGKTLQALAVILYRTMHGPSLVVAPTSVSLNWMDEIQRFAPTLNMIDIRQTPKDSSHTFQPFDIVICSYGLLQTRLQQLDSVDWQTIVLDEAQAIKNPATRRSQAAMKLGGQFKLITTGTPIENHLGELWNLFRFINPGLLGSLEHFNKRFALPISRDGQDESSQQLRKLIQPFILRRSKSQVLTELPARTDIVLTIEMSKQEMALYEAMRQQAIETLAAPAPAAKKGHRQLQILAEITRLRQACCNPQLVMKQAAPESSKLVQFAETLDELMENHHKALVFSQFVGHLKILEQLLKDKGINYQYLDGSTPVKERKKRVNAFQAGEGDVFLISLKAGGVGLNLTAADYVIHMDPWWNPAVEDQASDRAHRIGQTRPVTVYRFVMKDTIEEKIIALHHKKRDLADNLLAGTDVAEKLNAEDLLLLLKEDS